MAKKKEFRWPYHIDEKEKSIYVVVKNWMSACAACNIMRDRYPGYSCEYVSEERLVELSK